MNLHCGDCDHTFLLTPDGMTQNAACPNCGGTRLERDQPSPTHSDGDLRNMADPGIGLDQGGNPLQEGIWGQTDGGWAPWHKRDEQFASVKQARVTVIPGPGGIHFGPLSLLSDLRSITIDGKPVTRENTGEHFQKYAIPSSPHFRQPVTVDAHHPAFRDLAARIIEDGHGMRDAYGTDVQSLQSSIKAGLVPPPPPPVQAPPTLAKTAIFHPYDQYENHPYQDQRELAKAYQEAEQLYLQNGWEAAKSYLEQALQGHHEQQYAPHGIEPNIDPGIAEFGEDMLRNHGGDAPSMWQNPAGTAQPSGGETAPAPVDHSLAWEPGMHGRGLLVGGKVHTWNAYDPNTIHETNDHGIQHSEYGQQLAESGVHPDQIDYSSGIEIHPDGTVQSLTGRDATPFTQVDPRLKSGEDNSWSFSSVSNAPLFSSVNYERTLNMEPYLPWTHQGSVDEGQETATVVPGTNGLHNRVAFLPALVGVGAGALARKALPWLMKGALMGTGSNIIQGLGQPNQGQPSVDPQVALNQLSHVTADLVTPHGNPGYHDTPDGDTHQFDDQSTNPALHNPNIPGGAGGSDQGEDNVGAGIGADKPGFSPGVVEKASLLLPSLLDHFNSPESAANDPLIRELHELLEQEQPGYLDNVDEEAGNRFMQSLREPSAVAAKTANGWNNVPDIRDTNVPQTHFAPGAGQGVCTYCGGTANPDGSCPQCGAQNEPQGPQQPPLNPAPVQPGGQSIAPPGYTPFPGYTGKIAHDHQGPTTPEQTKAVAELLIEAGRHEEIPHMIEAPWDYAEELASITGRENVPPNVDPNEQPPPAPPQEIAPPGATMPVPNPADPSMAQPLARVALQEENPLAIPAAEQQGQPDPELQQDSSHTWKDSGGNILEVGKTYNMVSPQYQIPDVVKVIAVKPDSIVVEKAGQFSNNPEALSDPSDPSAQQSQGGYQYEVTREELELQKLTFEPNDGSLEPTPEEGDPQEQAPVNTEPQAVPDIEQHQLSSVQEEADVCPRCSDRRFSSEMSSATTSFHECFRCGHGWETKEEDYIDENVTKRAWVMESSGPDDDDFWDGYEKARTSRENGVSRNLSDIAARDPRLQAIKERLDANAQEHTAGRKFSPSEQREFIDEQGVARNADKLDLGGTHYESHRYVGERANGMNAPDEHLFMGF